MGFSSNPPPAFSSVSNPQYHLPPSCVPNLLCAQSENGSIQGRQKNGFKPYLVQFKNTFLPLTKAKQSLHSDSTWNHGKMKKKQRNKLGMIRMEPILYQAKSSVSSGQRRHAPHFSSSNIHENRLDLTLLKKNGFPENWTQAQTWIWYEMLVHTGPWNPIDSS